MAVPCTESCAKPTRPTHTACVAKTFYDLAGMPNDGAHIRHFVGLNGDIIFGIKASGPRVHHLLIKSNSVS